MITWPMNILTRPAGEGRKLLIHPDKALSRQCMRRDENGILRITDPEAINLLKKMDNSGRIRAHNEIKQQGHRHFYSRDKKGYYHFHGRRLDVCGEYPDIMDKFYENSKTLFPTLPKETVVDCELIWPGHPDSEVPTAIKNNKEMQIVCFGVPIREGELLFERKVTYRTGRHILHDLLDEKFIIPLGGEVIFYKDDIVAKLEELLREAEERRIEGWVLKEHAFSGWWKLKLVNEMDVFVTGFNVSDSDTRFGWITSVKIGCYKEGKIIDLGNVSGFNEEQMQLMTTEFKMHKDKVDYNRFMYRALRVQYQEVASKGKLKHAFFDCWRDDKNYTDCVMK